MHNICHLYIDYYDVEYGGIRVGECIEIDDIKSADKIEELDKL